MEFGSIIITGMVAVVLSTTTPSIYVADNTDAYDIMYESLYEDNVLNTEEYGKEYLTEEVIRNIISDIRENYEYDNVSTELVLSLCHSESTFNRYAKSSANCRGLMQLNPKWHIARMIKLGVTDMYDPYGNILLGMDYLSELIKCTNGDEYLAIMLYNEGSIATSHYEENGYSEYSKKIISDKQKYIP